jgi:flagellar protein FlgJ
MVSLNQNRPLLQQKQQRPVQKMENEASHSIVNEKFKNACADFEAIFIQHMFQSMKQSLPREGLFGQSSQMDMYESMYYQEVATQLARGKGLGMGEALYRQLMHQQKLADEQRAAADGSAEAVDMKNNHS